MVKKNRTKIETKLKKMTIKEAILKSLEEINALTKLYGLIII
jgi:hypothetical protein